MKAKITASAAAASVGGRKIAGAVAGECEQAFAPASRLLSPPVSPGRVGVFAVAVLLCVAVAGVWAADQTPPRMKVPARALKQESSLPSAGGEASRHQNRAVSSADYVPTAPGSVGTDVQRAPVNKAPAGNARIPGTGLGQDAGRLRDAQQLRDMQGAQDLRDARGLGRTDPQRMGGAGGGNPMTRLRGGQSGGERGGRLAGPSAESNENGSFVTGVHSGGGSSPGYLPGFEPRQGGGKNDSKSGGGVPGMPAGGNQNKPRGGFAGPLGGAPGNDNKSGGVAVVGGKANENKPVTGMPKPADDKPKGGEKPADKPKEKPEDKPQDKPPQDKPKDDKPQGDKPAGDKPAGDKLKDGEKPDKSMTSSTPAEDRGGGPVGPRFGGSTVNPGRSETGVGVGPRIGLGARGAVNPSGSLGGGGPAGSRMHDQGKLINPGAGGPDRP